MYYVVQINIFPITIRCTRHLVVSGWESIEFNNGRNIVCIYRLLTILLLLIFIIKIMKLHVIV